MCMTSVLDFEMRDHAYATHLTVYVFQNEYGIHLKFDLTYTGCRTVRKRVGAEDTIFIDFNNSLLLQKSCYC